ncbi:MAG: hypothetical protein AVDCRST_MAG73-3331, partial [uncultured Thermomicrobiales bacterium]
WRRCAPGRGRPPPRRRPRRPSRPTGCRWPTTPGTRSGPASTSRRASCRTTKPRSNRGWSSPSNRGRTGDRAAISAPDRKKWSSSRRPDPKSCRRSPGGS